MSHQDHPGSDRNRWKGMLFSGLRFSVVGAAAYSVWAFELTVAGSEAALYTAIALVFFVFGGLAFYPIVRAQINFPKFCLLFAGAFAGFSAAWCAVYFGLNRGQHSDFFGYLLGVVLLCLIFHLALGRRGGSLIAKVCVVFTLNTAGYFAGELLYYGYLVHHEMVTFGRIAWGFFHCFGLGAGFGWALWQSRPQSEPQS